MRRVRDWQPDLLLVTGDLAEDGSDETYVYLSQMLRKFDVPVLTVPGNHDRAEQQRVFFPNTPVDEPIGFESSHWQFIALNSAVDQKIPGYLSVQTTNELEGSLAQGTKPTVVILHHQPCAVGSSWIDRYPLEEPGRFLEVLEKSTRVKAVLWGHIHHQFGKSEQGIQWLGSPSTAANSLAHCEKFTFDPAGPACRWLKLSRTGRLETGLLGLNN